MTTTTAQDFLKLLPEVVIEPSVQDRVHTGGGQDQQMADGKHQIILVNVLQELEVEIGHDVEDVERQP